MDYKNFIKELTDLEEIYHTKFTERELNVMWRALKHLTNAQFHQAIDSAIREWGRDMYKFSTNRLLEFIEGKRHALLNQEAHQEWTHVLEQLNQSFDQPMQLQQKTLLALRRIGGISSIREAPVSQLTWKRKEFIEQYQEIEEVQKAVMAQKQLSPGLQQSVTDTFDHTTTSITPTFI